MTFKQLMVPFQSAQLGKSGLDAAIVIAKRFKAHLDVVHIRQHPKLPAIASYPIAMTYAEEKLDVLIAESDLLASDLEDQFNNSCEEHSISILESNLHTDDKGATASWSDQIGNVRFDLTSRARVSDIVILAKPNVDAPRYEMDVVEEVVFQSGRSAMIVPDAAMEKFPETVLIAWNGSRESARALAASLPVLQQAQKVTVMTVGNIIDMGEPTENVAAYLRLHGIHAEHSCIELDKNSNADTIFMEQATAENTDLIVTGAYSHNRWREVVLGGFTRHLLLHSNIPLLMAH